jgi:hypothetical protein
MPKDNINYSDTTIYKIYCKDETITDIYVGHTTNFNVRKYQHKNSCKDPNCNVKIYKTIRENGGWDNWNMVEIAKYNCKNSTEARIKEQEHFELLKASLNSCPPYIDKKKFFCSICNLQCDNQKKYNKHVTTILHNKHSLEPKIENDSELVPNDSKLFNCKKCNYSTSNKKDYNKHLNTKKHIDNHKVMTNGKKKLLTSNKCQCGKKYMFRQGLHVHKKTCNYQQKNQLNIIQQNQIILELIEDNREIKNLLIKQNKRFLKLLLTQIGSNKDINTYNNDSDNDIDNNSDNNDNNDSDNNDNNDSDNDIDNNNINNNNDNNSDNDGNNFNINMFINEKL